MHIMKCWANIVWKLHVACSHLHYWEMTMKQHFFWWWQKPTETQVGTLLFIPFLPRRPENLTCWKDENCLSKGKMVYPQTLENSKSLEIKLELTSFYFIFEGGWNSRCTFAIEFWRIFWAFLPSFLQLCTFLLCLQFNHRLRDFQN